jgi:hypothetical protein
MPYLTQLRLTILKTAEVVLAKISQSRWLAIALFLLASVTPLFYFVATHYFGSASQPPYGIFADLFLVMAPLGILYLALKNPIPGGIVAVLSVPLMELLWVTALWGFRWLQYTNGDRYVPAIGIQCVAMALAGVLFILRKTPTIEEKPIGPENEDEEETAQYGWFVTLQRGFLILTALALISTLIVGQWNLNDKIYLGLCLGVILFSWRDSLISGVTLIVGVPVGLYLIYLRSPPVTEVLNNFSPHSILPNGNWWTAHSFMILLSICVFIGGILSITWDWLSWAEAQDLESSDDDDTLADEET